MYRIFLVDVFSARSWSSRVFLVGLVAMANVASSRPPPDKEVGERRLDARCALGNVAEDDLKGERTMWESERVDLYTIHGDGKIRCTTISF